MCVNLIETHEVGESDARASSWAGKIDVSKCRANQTRRAAIRKTHSVNTTRSIRFAKFPSTPVLRKRAYMFMGVKRAFETSPRPLSLLLHARSEY